MTDRAGAPRRYLAYLLRLQAVGGSSEALAWQVSLEAPRTHERHTFADLESLVAYLQTEIGAGPALHLPPGPGPGNPHERPGAPSGHLEEI